MTDDSTTQTASAESSYDTNPELVEALELLLEHAKTGNLRSMAVVVAYQNGNAGNGRFIAPEDVFPILGVFEHLKFETLKVFTDMEFEPPAATERPQYEH